MLVIVPLGTKGSSGFPIITFFVCLVCALVYLFAHSDRDILALAYHPGSWDVGRMFTSVFAHGGILHLLGNLFFFYSFARTIETQISIVGYLFAFVLFVFATNIAFSFMAKGSIPTVGLSGVVSGYMGIFLFRFPKASIECFVWFLIVFWRVVEIPAILFILAFVAFDIIAFRSGEDTMVNHVAHLSGFVAGIVFRVLFWRLFSTEKPKRNQRIPSRKPAAIRR
jgi:membrane associated rhomboid family serine protease